MKFISLIVAAAALSACDWSARNNKKTENRLQALEEKVSFLQSELESQKRQLGICQAKVSPVDALLETIDRVAPLADLADLVNFVTVEGNDVTFQGANVHIRNGGGATDTVDGTGNLVIGYNEAPTGEDADRSGSHNLVIGPGHSFTSYGGYVGGFESTIAAPHAVVLTGTRNAATEPTAVVLVGRENVAAGRGSVVAAGQYNRVTGDNSFIGTGLDNEVEGSVSALVGGADQVLDGDFAVLLGDGAAVP